MNVSPDPRFICRSLTPKVLVLCGESFGRWVMREGPSDGIGAFIKETPETPLAASLCKEHSEKALPINEKVP